MTAIEQMAKVISNSNDGMWAIVHNEIRDADSLSWDAEVDAIYRNGQKVA